VAGFFMRGRMGGMIFRVKRMRPRFSIRWLLVVFAIVALTFYALFVRPTIVAQQLVADAKSGELKPRPSDMLPDYWLQKQWQFHDAQVLPRTWHDIWRLQRRVIVDATLKDESAVRHLALLDYTADPLNYQITNWRFAKNKAPPSPSELHRFFH
jgi:hypothetical protein